MQASGADAVGQLTKVGRGLRERRCVPELELSEDGRITLKRYILRVSVPPRGAPHLPPELLSRYHARYFTVRKGFQLKPCTAVTGAMGLRRALSCRGAPDVRGLYTALICKAVFAKVVYLFFSPYFPPPSHGRGAVHHNSNDHRPPSLDYV